MECENLASFSLTLPVDILSSLQHAHCRRSRIISPLRNSHSVQFPALMEQHKTSQWVGMECPTAPESGRYKLRPPDFIGPRCRRRRPFPGAPLPVKIIPQSCGDLWPFLDHKLATKLAAFSSVPLLPHWRRGSATARRSGAEIAPLPTRRPCEFASLAPLGCLAGALRR